MPVKAVKTTKDTEKVTNKNIYETGNVSQNGVKLFTIVPVSKDLVPKTLFAAPVMVTTKTIFSVTS